MGLLGQKWGALFSKGPGIDFYRATDNDLILTLALECGLLQLEKAWQSGNAGQNSGNDQLKQGLQAVICCSSSQQQAI